MKNKDGIVIKRGQVWLVGTLNDKHEIIATHMDKPISFCEKAESRYGTLTQLTGPGQSQLIKSHDGADLEAARAEGWEVWVEGMPGFDESCVEVMEWWHNTEWAECDTLVPRATHRYKLKAEQPRYKLFEIDWDDPHINAPSIRRDYGDVTLCILGKITEGYRIFGFTDDENWSDRYKNTAERGSFVNVPCDAYGNRKYAIGRYEGGR